MGVAVTESFAGTADADTYTPPFSADRNIGKICLGMTGRRFDPHVMPLALHWRREQTHENDGRDESHAEGAGSPAAVAAALNDASSFASAASRAVNCAGVTAFDPFKVAMIF